MERNYILDLNIPKNGRRSDRIKLANRVDLERIADLMLTDAICQNVYQRDLLFKQLQDRYDKRFSRFLMIENGREIAAVYSTYGESGGVVLLGGLLVHPLFRRQGLASKLMRHTFEALSCEGISGIAFVNHNNDPSLKLYEKLGGKQSFPTV